MNLNERATLIDELIDGSISEADFLRLEAEMRVNPEVRQAYYQRLKLDNALTAEAEVLASEDDKTVVPFWLEHARGLLSMAAIAVFTLLSILGWQVSQAPNPEKPLIAVEPVATGFAILADHSSAVWKDRPYLDRGDLLPQGMLEMESGIAQLELFSGVTVIVEGKAEFEIHSPMEMTVAQGKVRALVPTAAQGFKVSTPSGEVVDLGTEFALDVTSERSDMRVLDGEIEWHPNAKAKQLLTDGQSLRWTVGGQSAEGNSLAPSLPGINDLEKHFAQIKEERRMAWTEHSVAMGQDSRIIAYYPMKADTGWSRDVTDESPSQLHGTIVSARRDADRWDQSSSAVNFSPAGSRVRVAIPGEHHSLTFYCWARIDSLDRMYNSLFLTDGHDLHEPHWQIMSDGRLFFSVKKQEAIVRDGVKIADKHIAYSPSFWDPSLSGKWFQIVTVYDANEGTTTHYVNGEVISKDHLPERYVVDTVKIGNASIGNWNEPTRDEPLFALRNLNGAIDEFAIFNEALDAEEIASLYEQGRP